MSTDQFCSSLYLGNTGQSRREVKGEKREGKFSGDLPSELGKEE